jgi:DNA damage-inducible protein 1
MGILFIKQACAERLGLMRLVDKRYAGIAKGVGTSKIVGRVHAVDMKMGSNFFPISITVLENNDMEFLFGLDNLRRHQARILDSF